MHLSQGPVAVEEVEGHFLSLVVVVHNFSVPLVLAMVRKIAAGLAPSLALSARPLAAVVVEAVGAVDTAFAAAVVVAAVVADTVAAAAPVESVEMAAAMDLSIHLSLR